MWPVDKPPADPHPPAINLRDTRAKPPDGVPDPLVYDGPLNEFIHLTGTLAAYVAAAKIKTEYDYIIPTPVTSPAPQPAPPPPPADPGQPISTGSPVHYEGGVPDPNLQKRIQGHRHPRPPGT